MQEIFNSENCYIEPDSKKVKASKKHKCTSCNGIIKPKQKYFRFTSAEYIVWWDDSEDKTVVERLYRNEKYCIKCNYKHHKHIMRSEKRVDNCPDENFKHQWNGGWSGGVPDGGDCDYVCVNACNLGC